MKGERTNEDLVKEYRSGELKALDTLLKYYEVSLRRFIRTISWVKDESFIDDILQEVRVIIFKRIRSGKFIPTSAGSFNTWAYRICQNICWKENKKRAGEPRPISAYYPEEPTGIPDDLLPQMPMETVNYDFLATKLKDFLEYLSLEEQKLMRLISQGKKYKEIQQDPSFNKYSLDYLKHKVSNIRKKMLRIKEAKYGK